MSAADGIELAGSGRHRPPRSAARQGKRPHPLVRAFLRVPLFYKILLANAVLVGFGVFVGAWATGGFGRPAPDRPLVEVVAILAGAVILLSLIVNGLLVRLALEPLAGLGRAAARIQEGDFTARAPSSPLADRDLESLIQTFNAMLDGLSVYRRRLREMAARALAAQEEERKRIARELHDETAQMLAAILVRLRLLQQMDAASAESELEEVRSAVSQALEGVRLFARGLRPPDLDELGLPAAIRSHARKLEQGTRALRITVEADESVREVLSPEAELVLYRILQEALSNVVRHSGATEATVRIRRDGDTVIAEVEDNGAGFSVEAVERAGNGLGLFGMKERATYVDGDVVIDSAPGRGSRVIARVPVRATA